MSNSWLIRSYRFTEDENDTDLQSSSVSVQGRKPFVVVGPLSSSDSWERVRNKHSFPYNCRVVIVGLTDPSLSDDKRNDIIKILVTAQSAENIGIENLCLVPTPYETTLPAGQRIVAPPDEVRISGNWCLVADPTNLYPSRIRNINKTLCPVETPKTTQIPVDTTTTIRKRSRPLNQRKKRAFTAIQNDD